MARHRFAVLSLAIVALASSFWFLVDVLGTVTRSTPAFGVVAFENRFNDLRYAIQPLGIYGYLSDNQPDNPSALAEYHLTQYTLAPAIVRPTGNMSQVIVNYHSKDLDFKFLRANHLVPIRDFGNGVALCRRSP